MREVFLDEDTIFAPITPNMHSAITVIRISGDKAIEAVDRIFKGKKRVKDMATHTLLYGNIIDKNEKIDDVVVALMRKPKSYTGEDVVEISCHGNPIIVGRIMELLKAQGLRMALPGEFTKRAVLNGKIDLLQAEAVNSLITSKNLSNVKISRNILDGKLSEEIKSVKEELLNLLAYLEVLVDHPEEDLANRDWEFIKSSIKNCILKLKKLLARSQKSRFFSEGLKICIAGKTNVGKSSLMNALVEEDRSIVSNIPGTTRDVVKEIISIEGVPISLSDTAGIRRSKNPIETEGIKRTIDSILSADAIILVFDSSKKLSDSDINLVNMIKDYIRNKNVFVVINKIDTLVEVQKLQTTSEKLPILEKVKHKVSKIFEDANLNVSEYFLVSAKYRYGINELSKSIIKNLVGDVEDEINNILINNERQRKLIEDTISSLEEAYETTLNRMSEEFIAIGIRDALSYIGEMIGEVTTEDLMDKIFQNFCIGK
ncbi:MAG: tRNA uridine-5-carboxymethylaminomethyl(34) synthesis GTPase MnmE [Brevinematales bacterium]|nr:tRNA uridine-5-carboxymethylaminomethyl(34) synthesis GTPase MnmE [Brevinematales bacterium]